MQASITPLSISERPAQLDAITEAGFADVEYFEHDLLVHDVSSSEVGQQVREPGFENLLFQPFRDFEFMPEPQHRLLIWGASQ